ncbi:MULTISPECIES: hypothetical protein [Rhizobium]|uniref:BA14K family protein n=1 Tax=Rhizobium rhododendri TaxID=2506430 RepID=A0ABY8IGJ4_9HYPH|nr:MULTISPECIES: hypothetical protein [Rhizobium]MBZ5763011.1 hypothetical protein [Rhizobium sp. VS19-DR96]MBZ5768883.1 hypothetical protein [Rhizobium sp. VS19-DR129.2]MBZ5776511.1 hypothetical protein [Rhizobium sp. VS19-DRK62.2]MBZ5787667.1 hypothetical protein [Rhizobium sp. VS19-DR121]MBZ5805160.1 hypothetical protein [Rhizobium sp. VS19-DR181]
MKIFATAFLTASMAIGSLFAVSAPVAAAPLAPVQITQSSDVVQVRDERWRHNRHERRSWRHDRREFRHGRGEWRRDRGYHNRREWHRHHRRNGVIIRL